MPSPTTSSIWPFCPAIAAPSSLPTKVSCSEQNRGEKGVEGGLALQVGSG